MSQFLSLDLCRALDQKIKKVLIEHNIQYQVKYLDQFFLEVRLAGINVSLIKSALRQAKAKINQRLKYSRDKKWNNDNRERTRSYYHRKKILGRMAIHE